MSVPSTPTSPKPHPHPPSHPRTPSRGSISPTSPEPPSPSDHIDHRKIHTLPRARTHEEHHSPHESKTLSSKDVEYAQEREALRKEATEKEATMTDEQKERRTEHRKKIEEEIKTTERSYCASLNTLHTTFCIPLKSHASESGFNVSAEQLEALLLNLETLVNFHNAFLIDLEKSEEPASVILKFGDFFRLYKRYLNGYTSCLNAFTELRNNTKFQTFLTDVRKNLATKGTLDLMSYLIMPVQRVPRYVLLLKELSRFTSPSHSEWQAIEDALLKLKDVAADINEAKRQMEHMTRLLEVQNRIQGEFGTLVVPHRRLLREGPLHEMTSARLLGSLKPEARIFFLFSDIFLWTTDTFRFKGYLQLVTATLEDDKKTGPNMFSLTTSKLHITVACKDAAEKESWMKDIQDVTEQAKLTRGQAMKVRTMKIKRSHVHAHEARSHLHDTLLTGLQSISVAGDDGEVEVEEKTEEEKEQELQHEKRVHAAEEREKMLADIAKEQEEKGGGGSFKVRTIKSRVPHQASQKTLERTHSTDHGLDASDHRSSRPSLIGEGHGTTVCTCQDPVPEGGEKKPCPVHPYG